ncbi:MAG TPA: 2-dehydropantoate 2-reductase [Bradyrhizobium sp.]|jgi:2-dehydropantoate 2-reductase|nr:2-dehydropantoate 2-reductase [Bradyrhizobium sp.]
MRICIFGAGAVGSHFAVRLALAGHDVACVMRGPHLEAVKADGLTLRVGDAEFSARVNASDDPAALGPQDFVISTLKATGLSSLAAGLRPLLRDDTAIVFAQNGIPWWYDLGLPADHPPPPNLSFLDPGGLLRAAIPKERIIGGVIFSANELVAPGIVVNNSTDRNMLLVGECDDRATARIERLRVALGEALIQSPPEPRIREVIWTKLIGNMSISVLCLLTGQTVKAAVQEPALRDVVPHLLEEAQAVARSCYPDVKRDTRGGAPADHKPSLLQDYELGRAMEIDALVRAPAAFAKAAGLSTPMLDMLAGLAIRQARDKGLYQAVYQSQPSS